MVGRGPGEGCLVCRGPLDTGCQLPCALQATRWSREVSEKGRGWMEGEFGIETTDGGDCASKVTSSGDGATNGDCCGDFDKPRGGGSVTMEELLEEMCYSCQLGVGRKNLAEVFPWRLVEQVGVRKRRRAMEEEIQDFLLD